jgi:galactokinase
VCPSPATGPGGRKRDAATIEDDPAVGADDTVERGTGRAERRAGGSAPRTFWAPGRVNLIGEHTDYSGGLVLPVALDLGVTLQVTAVGNVMRVTSDDGDAQRYADAVAAELAARGRPARGVEAAITTTLPIGAGLSSSAALGVALALALTTLSDLSFGELELAEVAQRAETRATGVPCGIMDQAASILGRPGHAVLLDTSSLHWRTVRLPTDHALVLVDSGVVRRLEHSAYTRRRAELERGLAGASDPVARRRVRHVETENERVRETVGLLETAPLNTRRLGEVFRRAHESLRDDFEVSTPELDELVGLAYDLGASAARMTGAGFGGSIVALVPDDRAQRFTEEIVAAYSGAGTARIGSAAGGAREL